MSKKGSQISGGNSEYGRVASDFYPTPPEATQAIIDYLSNELHGKHIWEPACGEYHMVNVFRKNGLQCTGTDILFGNDYLTMDPIPCDWIITNPPFRLAERFIRRSMEHGKPLALLLKVQFWNAACRLGLFVESQPSHVLPLTWRPDFLFGSRGGGSPLMDMMWVVWTLHDGPTIFRPLDRPL